MPYAVIYALIGYLSGSVLYAEVFCGIFGRKNAIEQSRDANPGTANAFLYGGFWCGICTLIFDMAKGFVPVYAYVHMTQMNLAESNGLALVLAAPVAGHIFPVWRHFKGGKGIACTGGLLIGFCPLAVPISLGIFILVVAITRYVSLGSILGVISLEIQIIVFGQMGLLSVPEQYLTEVYIVFGFVAGLAIILHHANIGRLLKGTENKFSFHSKKQEA